MTVVGQHLKSGFARAGEAYLSVARMCAAISYMPNLRDRERLIEKGGGPVSRRMDSQSSALRHCAYVVTFEPSRLR
jgi:hypothetical protein